MNNCRFWLAKSTFGCDVFVGGGVALLYASRDLDKIPTTNFDQKVGVQIIQNALKVQFTLWNQRDCCEHAWGMCIFLMSWNFGTVWT